MAYARSSIEGNLVFVAHLGTPRAIVRERTTDAAVWCSVPEHLHDTFVSLFGKQVILEGWVHYRSTDGHPITITDVASIRQRPVGRPLEEFIGAIPHLTGGLGDDEFVAVMRSDE